MPERGCHECGTLCYSGGSETVSDQVYLFAGCFNVKIEGISLPFLMDTVYLKVDVSPSKSTTVGAADILWSCSVVA